MPFGELASAVAPALPVAQAIGRWGNWFNNELYGRPTDLPWGLEIHRWDTGAARAVTGPDGEAVVLGTFHPIFLYESVFLLLLAVALLVLDRRVRLAPGQLFGAYVAGYPLGRVVLETMRTDEAEIILGQRLNVWTSLAVLALGVAIWVVAGRRGQRRPTTGDEDLTMRDEQVTR